MLVVFSDWDLATEGHTGVAGNAPEERKRLVQQSLRNVANKCTFIKVQAPESSLLPLGSLVHNASMLRFLESAWERWTVEWKKKPNDHLKGVFCSADADPNSSTPPPFVAGFFAPKEVGQTPTSGVLGQACFFAMDKETPIHESTVKALKWDLAVTKEAVRSILAKETRLVYAQITHPGHHAGPNSYGGFCFINHAGVAVRLLQSTYKRVAVVDVDYHSGNGTMCIFWDDPSVFFASLHANPEDEYPFNAGFTDQIGGENARGSTLNIPLSGGTTWPSYKTHLQRVIDAIKKFGAEALVVSLGVDTLRDDPVALPRSKLCLDPPDYAAMGRMLMHDGLCLPTIVVQEGGYKLDDVPLAISAFLTGSIGLHKNASL